MVQHGSGRGNGGMASMQKDNRGRQAQEEKQGDVCGLTTNFKHDKGSRMGQHNAASSGEHKKMGRTTCTYFSRPVQWTSLDAIRWETLQCRAAMGGRCIIVMPGEYAAHRARKSK